MHYNELKVRVLGLFQPGHELSSLKARELLSRDTALNLTDKAVEMALMRYWRHGLLSRNRRGRLFHYSLTERGVARLAWLRKK
jgi:DNA-binding transcriptional regulator PaaX